VCEVSDTGTGMPQEVVAKIFEPFFSTKEVGKGTGLGLSMVYGIIKQTGGFIFCDSAEGIGTTFRIYLPRFAGKVVEAEPARTQARAPSGAQLDDPTGTGTILLVEDEEPVRKFAARALVRQGYSVLEAGSGREALDVMAQTSAQIDLVVSDIVMPEMNGPTLLKNLRRTQPDLKIVFISGYAEDHLKTLTADDEFTYLPKPFQLKDLVWTVKQAMAKDG
ncbi:MAG: response regulator, partial [Pseudomonadota bacterium]